MIYINLKYLLLLFLVLYIVSCEKDNPIKTDNHKNLTDCPPPVDHGYGPKEPSYYENRQRISPKLDKLAFVLGESNLEILDLIKGTTQVIDIQSKLPSNVKFIAVYDPIWCPYDNNKLLVTCVTSTDTVGNGKNFIWGVNVYAFSLDGNEFANFTPKIFGKAGAINGINVLNWLHGSSPSNDTIHLSPGNLYIPQLDLLIKNAIKRNYISESPDGNYFFGHIFNPSNTYGEFTVNDFNFHFSDSISVLDHISWSPDSKKIAISVLPRDTTTNSMYMRNREIWIIDVEKLLMTKHAIALVKIINIRALFCKYAFSGLWAEYISNTSLAVTMHKDGDDFAPIWEITDDGKLVKQLTLKP